MNEYNLNILLIVLNYILTIKLNSNVFLYRFKIRVIIFILKFLL